MAIKKELASTSIPLDNLSLDAERMIVLEVGTHVMASFFSSFLHSDLCLGSYVEVGAAL